MNALTMSSFGGNSYSYDSSGQRQQDSYSRERRGGSGGRYPEDGVGDNAGSRDRYGAEQEEGRYYNGQGGGGGNGGGGGGRYESERDEGRYSGGRYRNSSGSGHDRHYGGSTGRGRYGSERGDDDGRYGGGQGYGGSRYGTDDTGYGGGGGGRQYGAAEQYNDGGRYYRSGRGGGGRSSVGGRGGDYSNRTAAMWQATPPSSFGPSSFSASASVNTAPSSSAFAASANAAFPAAAGISSYASANAAAGAIDRDSDAAAAASNSAMDGWRMMPHLFDTWDVDNSGSINRYELTVGMVRMIKEAGLALTMNDVYRIMDEVDLNDDRQLDRREFGCFVSRVAAAADVSLDGVTAGLLRQREDEANRRLEKIKQSQNLDLAHEGWKMMPHLFDTWDVDNSGSIDKFELTSGMSQAIKSNGLDITVGQVCDIMREVDLNDDRTLDRREFGAFLSRVAQAANISFDGLAFLLMKQREAEARRRLERIKIENQSNEQAWVRMPELFRMWDTDDDGYVNREEVAMAVDNLIRRSEITKISLAECLRLMDEVDTNGDRVLNQMEFGAFMARLALASGVLLEKLVKYFMQDHQKRREGQQAGGTRNGGGNRKSRFGSMFARMRVTLAEEEIIDAPM